MPRQTANLKRRGLQKLRSSRKREAFKLLGFFSMARSQAWKAFRLHAKAVVLVWAVSLALPTLGFLVDQTLGGSLRADGIHPRETSHLLGMLWAPFLHGSWQHLANNMAMLAVLAPLVLVVSVRRYLAVVAVSMLTSGVGVWLFGATNSVHIGASGVLFGLLAYLLSIGLFERRLGSVVVSSLVLLYQGSVMAGVLPGNPGVSWESHFFGACGGVLCAFVVGARVRKASKRTQSPHAARGR